MLNEPFEQVRDATTPDEMRAELERLSYQDGLTRKVFDMARYRGLSGEDKYAVLSYYAMRELQALRQRTLIDLSLNVRPQVIFSSPQTREEEK